MAFSNSNEKILLDLLTDIEAACSELSDGSLKTRIISKLEDGEKIVLDNIERARHGGPLLDEHQRDRYQNRESIQKLRA